MIETGQSLQERFFPTLTCFGCGPANPKGLRISSFDAGDGTVRGTFRPWPEHDNGLGYLNGGIVSTLLDCHSAAAVALESERLGLRGPDDAALCYVTAGLDVAFRRPSPLHEPAELVARVESADADVVRVTSELHWQGKLRASALATWKRWRPRTAPDPEQRIHRVG